MSKLVCIVGPTATGKTKKAIELSKHQPSILISADSRQVYRGMDIVTGKDHPPGIMLHGIDLVSPDQLCSVSVWYEAVMPHIEQAWVEGKQVIVVGGTGLYVKALTAGIPTLKIPVNQSLRDQLSHLSIPELQLRLKGEDSTKFASMNHSDLNNPRRLIRAIEISLSDTKPEPKFMIPESSLIGYRYADPEVQRHHILNRVISRLRLGAVEEIKHLLKIYDPNLPSMTAIGYKSLIQYINKEIDESTMIALWVEGELAYSKRQMTWFRKQPTIWYDVETIGAI